MSSFKMLCFTVMFNLAALCQPSYGMTDNELIAIRNGFDARRNDMLNSQISNPYPATADHNNVQGYTWGKLDFALAALYMNSHIEAANASIIQACNNLVTKNALSGEFGFHWQGPIFFRIYEYFNSKSKFFPGRLSAAAEKAMCDVLWRWAKHESKIVDTNVAAYRTWYLWGTENHDAMHDGTAWMAVKILKDVEPYKGYLLDDGKTVAQHYDGWNKYLSEYLRERAKRGLLVERASPGYSKYTLQNWYNYYDFSEDEILRSRAGMLLDLWWADWAQEQINGVRGGGKARAYQQNVFSAADDASYSMCWFYFGKIGRPENKHPGMMCMATSTYRLPLVVMDITLDVAGRGVYEAKARRPALAAAKVETGHLVNPDLDGKLSYSYCTPDFIIGTDMLENRHDDDWTKISSQNRWHGVIFASDPDARIFPQCVGLRNGKTYNQHWSVQNKGTQITQKLSQSTQAGAMRVYFSKKGISNRVEEDGWVFAIAGNAFAAVRPAYGGYAWDDDRWLRSKEQYAPVIIEVAQKEKFKDFAAFKAAVKANILKVDAGVLTYKGLLDSGMFTFYTKTAQPPKINGVPVNYYPNYTFASPFVNEDWASGIVVISKGQRRLTLDFNKEKNATTK